MRITKAFTEFFNSEKSGGIVLLLATAASLLLANSIFKTGYTQLWHVELGHHSLVEWINDGLMAIFFLMIGLELEREIYEGELSDLRTAALPFFGALGGMIIPALIYLAMNLGLTTQPGAGIPMATDIAFAIGILSLLGKRVPSSLKVFLIALAVIDDLGAIIVITLFYSTTISLSYFLLSLGVFALLIVLNRLKVYNLIPYLAGGLLMWYFMSKSGVHATITGVMLAFAIPFSRNGKRSPSYILQHLLHKPVAFVILPLFALANTCITVNDGWQSSLLTPGSLGIILGLVVGKPLGITLFSFLSVKMRWCKLPDEISWRSIFGVGILGGIGFTMSIFISFLAYDDEALTNLSKISILAASFIAGVTGLVFLLITQRKQYTDELLPFDVIEYKQQRKEHVQGSSEE